MIAQKILISISVAFGFSSILMLIVSQMQTEIKKEEFWFGLAFKSLFLFGITTAIFIFTTIWIK